MRKRIVIRNGKKYIVNTPDDGDCGWGDGVGPGGQAGTLWMKSITDDLWYEVNLVGTSGSFLNPPTIYVNPTPINWVSSDLGYQLLYYSSSVYQTFLSGSGAAVTMSISQTPWPDSSDAKPYLLLRSLTDGYYYPIYAKSGSIYLEVNQNNRVWMDPQTSPPIISEPKGSIEFTVTSSYLTVPASDDWAMGTGDFTVEWFQYQTIASQIPYYRWPRIFEVGAYNDAAVIKFGVTNESSTLYVWLAGVFVYSKALTNFINQWCHFAVCRSGSNFTVYKDGAMFGNTFVNTSNITSDTRNMYIGAESGSSEHGTYTGTTFPGRITNLHIVKGQCLYTGSTITVPTTPIRPTPNTKLLLLAGNAQYLTKDSSGTNKLVTNYAGSASWSSATPF